MKAMKNLNWGKVSMIATVLGGIVSLLGGIASTLDARKTAVDTAKEETLKYINLVENVGVAEEK